VNTPVKLIAVFLLVFAVVGCKSTKKDIEPAPPPVVEAPAPEPAPVVQPEPVEKPAGLPSDPAELNRLARENGWIKDAFFAYDSNALSDEARANLELSARWLMEHPEVSLTVEGHCDERGTEQYNLALGDRRASAARDFLVARGVAANRVGTVSYGEERPFAQGSNEAAWAQNRRAHLNLRLGN
jgi:peptidoglycan-associated lipoprotein